ncbi:carboxypeptidase-like regulatory domain-containing protein [Tenacibaculum soleae]|uniref:carboxypeptidase-like regulatory domain-containing protein n=1 Tax=Tenacibaculum soleae TaxID=447689 RepID=UPI0026E433B4|nr:carboxypeptidase-like regulatory domain-containing protein [Tenacibaculum soleae]MDO6812632.1 carboxypeptidase-like regulatory domain-containing protein [Tenacibaculum soleae]
MGRKTKVNTLFFSLFFFLICTYSFSQTIISGTLKDNKNNIITGNVILKDSLLKNYISYTYANKKGYYQLKTNKTGNFNLVFSSLGFKPKTTPIVVHKNQAEITVNVVLQEDAISLDEVVIKAEKSVFTEKDTIRFRTKAFTNGTEQTVEDLLKKIPGLNIDSEGRIKVGNQEIEKLMIDGDDFFEKGYKVLSKNMPAHPIEEVEVLKKYSNNHLLKGIENSDKVALNLKLNEKSKRIWFGNISLGYGLFSENRYETKANLMNFGKKNKYFFLTSLNNTGIDVTGSINQLINPTSYNEPGSIGDNKSTRNLLNLAIYNSFFDKERTNFNNTELTSLNAIFNPSKKLKIKALSFLNWDENSDAKTSIDNINTGNTNFSNTENSELNNDKKIAFGKVDIIYNIDKNKMLAATTKYKYGNFNDSSNLTFNGNSTTENLKHQNNIFDQKIIFTNRLNNKKVYVTTGRFINEKSPQNYQTNQFLFQDLFPNSANANNIKQLSNNEMTFAGFNTHLLTKKENGDLLELQLGNEYRADKLNTQLTLLENNTIINSPTDYKNTTEYKVNDAYLKTKYHLKIKDLRLIGKLNFHNLTNNLNDNTLNKSENYFYINPSIGIDWKINDKNKITSSVSYNTTNAKIVDVYNNFALTSFRSFTKGTGNFNQLNASTANLNYSLGNYSDRFFAYFSLMYTKNYDFFSSNSLIQQNYNQAEKIIIKDREYVSINSKIDYYFKSISSNLKLDVGYTKSEFKNSVNNTGLRKVTSNNYNYGVNLRSGFRGFFNYHFGTKWNTSKIQQSSFKNSFTNNKSFLDLSFVFSKKFNADIQSERYYFGNLEKDATYNFVDVSVTYNLIDNKLTLFLTGKNLLNTKTFKSFSISDIGTSTTEYRLLPRFALLKLKYRF